MKEKSNYAITESILSTFTNIILFVFKLWVGTLVGSVALIADAWHTLSDSISSIFIFVGIKLSKRPADSKHPFGHGRMEFITSMFIAIFLGYIGFTFISKGIYSFTHHRTVHFTKAAIYVTILSILTKEILAQFAFYMAKKSDSLAVKADGWHHRSDAISSIIILIGIFVSKYFWWIDSFLGIVVSAIIFYMAYQILNKSVSALLGENASSDLKNQIKALLPKDKDLSFHHFHLHDYHYHKEVTFHIKVNPEMKIKDAHKIADSIEKQIKEKFKIDATIHVEPQK